MLLGTPLSSRSSRAPFLLGLLGAAVGFAACAGDEPVGTGAIGGGAGRATAGAAGQAGGGGGAAAFGGAQPAGQAGRAGGGMSGAGQAGSGISAAGQAGSGTFGAGQGGAGQGGTSSGGVGGAPGGQAGSSAGGVGGQAGGPVDFDGCVHPLIQPPGWQATTKTWVAAFSAPDGSPMATYPTGVGFPVPLGAARGGYTVIPFTPIANSTVTLSWDQVQSNPSQGYPKPRPATSMFIGISRCPGDLRPSDLGASGNPWLQEGCRRTGGGASIVHRSTNKPSDAFVCRVEPGVVHYLTIAAVDTSDGLTLGEHTCSDVAPNAALGCDVQAVHTAVTQ